MKITDLQYEEKKFLSVIDEVVGDKKELTDEDINKILVAHQIYTEKILAKGYECFIKRYEDIIHNQKTNQEIILTEY